MRNDGHCKSALAEREDILQSIAQLLEFEQVRISCTPIPSDSSERRAQQDITQIASSLSSTAVQERLEQVCVISVEFTERCGVMQMAPPALIAVVALLCCAPGMHALSRQCCGALCRAGIAPPLVGLLASEPDSPRCTEVCPIVTFQRPPVNLLSCRLAALPTVPTASAARKEHQGWVPGH